MNSSKKRNASLLQWLSSTSQQCRRDQRAVQLGNGNGYERLEDKRLLAGVVTQVDYFDTWDGVVPSMDVSGIAYHAPSGSLYLADSEADENQPIQAENVFEVSLAGNQYLQGIASGNTEPTGITFSENDGYFYVSNNTGAGTITRYDANFNSLQVISTTNDVASTTDPEGVTSSPSTGYIYVVDGGDGGSQILAYDSDLVFQYSFSYSNEIVDAEGIAFNPENHHLYVVSDTQMKIVEYSLSGTYVDEYDISGLPGSVSPQGLTFAPTSDPLDDPDSLALYIADGGFNGFPDGGVYEILVSDGQWPLIHNSVVSDNPADTSPHIILDAAQGEQNVYAFEQIGRTMYAGGRFDEVQDPLMTTTYSRQNFVAFDADTGVISPLNLSFDGLVTGIEASEDETALYISGAFSEVNGITRRGIMKFDLVNNQIDPVFAPTGMRTVSNIKLVNGYLIAAGNFDKHLMAMDLTTGADLGYIDIEFSGVVDQTDETRVRRLAVSPDGTRLVGTGNFASVNGQPQRMVFSLNLGSPATLSNWYAPRFDVDCPANNRLPAQGVDFSPDGSYFVIVTTGATNFNGLCDAAARFETADESHDVEPTWINWTGGDTLYSVEITGPAVYVGGHQRWLDNPQGSDFAGPGAVSRPGIGAIDPVTGMALEWNPTKSRNHGTLALFATPDGLWVGSDGERFGQEDHVGIGFVPLDPRSPADTVRPNTFIDSGPSGPVSSTSATFSFSASESSTFQYSLDGGAYVPTASSLTIENLSAGAHTLKVVAVDGSYNMDATPGETSWTVIPPGSELVGNPGFEVDLTGWKGDRSSNTLTRVAGGHSGGWALETTNTVAGGVGIDDSPNWVGSTDEGSYTASIWARSDTPGLTLKLRLREYVDGSRVGTVTETLALTSSWQQVSANYTPVVLGSTLNFEAYASNAPVGASFQVDDASIKLDVITNDPEVIITESDGSTDVAEGGAVDTYDVVLASAPTANVTVTVNSDSQSVATTEGVATILSADFNTDENGFSYVDDFYGTSEPNYASGVRLPSGGFIGGGLQVKVGGIDDADIFEMSGGWQTTFTLNEPTAVTLNLKYNLTQEGNYDAGEDSEALVSIDGIPRATIAQIFGDGGPQSTGWQSFELITGVLSDGSHTLTIGAYNNKKTFNDESTELLIDDVLMVADSAGETLTFTPTNWSFPQTVTVAAVDDALVEGQHISTITHTASSADSNYNGIGIDDVTANITDNELPPESSLYLTLYSGATLPGNISADNEDILGFDGANFSILFDGSDVGLSGTNVDAFARIAPDEILLSFRSPEVIPGIAGTVDDSDVVKFTATQLGETTSGTFEMFFDGSLSGLSTSAEDINAIDIHDDGRLVVSTVGNIDVPGVSGRDEDLVAFTPATPGDYSSGTWSMYFDGSDVGYGGEDTFAMALDANGDIHLSTTNAFSVGGVSGDDEDVFTFIPTQLGNSTAGTFSSTLLFDGSQFGLTANDVNGIDLPIQSAQAPGPASPGGPAGPGAPGFLAPAASGESTLLSPMIPTASTSVWAVAPVVQFPASERIGIADSPSRLVGTNEMNTRMDQAQEVDRFGEHVQNRESNQTNSQRFSFHDASTINDVFTDWDNSFDLLDLETQPEFARS